MAQIDWAFVQANSGDILADGFEAMRPAGKAQRLRLGRKEMEEFNLARRGVAVKVDEDFAGLWDIVQAQHERLLKEGEKAVLAARPVPWFDRTPPSTPGVYLVLYRNQLIHIGEAPDMSARHETHSDDTPFSALRRKIGKDLLGYELRDAGGRMRCFTDDEDWKVTRTLMGCNAAFIEVAFGRLELQGRLVDRLMPKPARTKASKAERGRPEKSGVPKDPAV